MLLRLKGYNALQKTSCDVGIHFGDFRDYLVKIGYNKKNYVCLPETPDAFRQRSS